MILSFRWLCVAAVACIANFNYKMDLARLNQQFGIAMRGTRSRRLKERKENIPVYEIGA